MSKKQKPAEPSQVERCCYYSKFFNIITTSDGKYVVLDNLNQNRVLETGTISLDDWEAFDQLVLKVYTENDFPL